MNTRNIATCLLWMLGLALAACSDDFLDTEDKNSLSPDNYPTTMVHLTDMTNGVYGTQHSFGLFGHNMLGKNLYCWDHTADLSWINTISWNALTQNNTSLNDEFLRDTWRDAWKGVQRSNALLAAVENYREKYAKADQEAQLTLIEGEAHFLRAWFYFYIASIWNEDFISGSSGGDKLGVPINTKVAENLDESRLPRATVRETWDFIISDLKTAETLLGSHEWTAAKEKHRANAWAVRAMLGKVYAFADDWTNAKTYLANVVDNSGKSLVPFNTYKEMFNGKNEFSSESIFEVHMNVDVSTWGAWGDQSAGSGIGMVIAPTFADNDGNQAQSGWSNVFPHDKNLARFGFNLPIPASPSDPTYIAQSKTLRDTKAVDPRLYVALQQPYLDSMLVDGNKRPIAYYWEIPNGQFYAWSFRKYVNRDGTEYQVNVNNGSNFYFLRLADIYLLYAEALIETGEPAQGLEYINKVKRRAYGYPVDSPSPVDYASLTAATSASDDVLKNDPLKYERWAELFGEGHWWFDVRRWKIGAQEAAYYVRTRGGAINWTDSDYAQPIPLDELLANGSIKQNQGYPER